MPIAARAHYERGFAHSHERRSPQAGDSSIPTTSVVGGTEATATSNQVTALANSLPIDLRALSGIIVVLGLFILGKCHTNLVAIFPLIKKPGVAFWKIKTWRRSKKIPASNWVTTTDEKAAFSTRMDVEAVAMEKPGKVVLRPVVPSAAAGVGWVPQLRVDINLPKPTKKRSKHVTKAWERNLAELMAHPISEREPPPSYVVANPTTPDTSDTPVIPASPPRESPSPPPAPPPPPPPAPLKLTFDDVVPPPSAHKVTPSTARTSSYGPQPVHAPRQSIAGKGDKKLPRLMTVEHAFEPTMDDELLVSVEETVRLLEEYEDEWCLVQRVGRIDAQKGVIPRLCLTERPDFVPAHPGLPCAGSYRL